MTNKKLQEILKQYPDDMLVGTYCTDNPDSETVDVSIRTWIHTNYPYDKPDYEYIYIE